MPFCGVEEGSGYGVLQVQSCRLDLLQGWILNATTKWEDMSKQGTNDLFISIWSCAACAKSVGVSISKSKLEEPSFFSVSLKSELVNSSQSFTVGSKFLLP